MRIVLGFVMCIIVCFGFIVGTWTPEPLQIAAGSIMGGLAILSLVFLWGLKGSGDGAMAMALILLYVIVPGFLFCAGEVIGVAVRHYWL